MSVKRKTPPALAEVIMHRQPEVLNWIEEKMRVKTLPTDQQAEHVQKQTVGEMVAYMDGYNACLEEVMHRFNCYAGFMYAGPRQRVGGVESRRSVGPDDTSYREWRRLYYTNGIAKK